MVCEHEIPTPIQKIEIAKGSNEAGRIQGPLEKEMPRRNSRGIRVEAGKNPSVCGEHDNIAVNAVLLCVFRQAMAERLRTAGGPRQNELADVRILER